MRIVIGPTINDLKIFGEGERELSSDLLVRRIEFVADSKEEEMTQVKLTCYIDQLELVVDDSRVDLLALQRPKGKG